jgi:hypothetical protein
MLMNGRPNLAAATLETTPNLQSWLSNVLVWLLVYVVHPIHAFVALNAVTRTTMPTYLPDRLTAHVL